MSFPMRGQAVAILLQSDLCAEQIMDVGPTVSQAVELSECVMVEGMGGPMRCQRDLKSAGEV